MQIKIQARNFSVTHAIRVHIERRLNYALSGSHQHIKRILVRLSDINGPRGGEDKRCQLELVLSGQTLVVEDTKSDLYTAVNSATSRAGRNVARWLRRRRGINRADTPDRKLLLEHNP